MWLLAVALGLILELAVIVVLGRGATREDDVDEEFPLPRSAVPEPRDGSADRLPLVASERYRPGLLSPRREGP